MTLKFSSHSSWVKLFGDGFEESRLVDASRLGKAAKIKGGRTFYILSAFPMLGYFLETALQAPQTGNEGLIAVTVNPNLIELLFPHHL